MPLRRFIPLALALAAGAGSPGALLVLAQGAQEAARPAPVTDPRAFLEFAVSSARLQAQAAEIALKREPRPEVKAFAAEVAAFRREQAGRLQALAQERNWALPALKEFEHQVVLENLEPLDYLALSRRYAELQVQALEQEVRGYLAAEQSGDEALKRLAQELLPPLRQQQDKARQLRKSVGP